MESFNVKNGTGGTTLNMPPEEITVYRICNAVKPQFCKIYIPTLHTKASKLCPVGRNIRTAVLQHSYSKFESALEDSLKIVTLADMIWDYHMQLEKEK